MKKLKEVAKEELLEIIVAYTEYIEDVNDDLLFGEVEEVLTIEEFYNLEYNNK